MKPKRQTLKNHSSLNLDLEPSAPRNHKPWTKLQVIHVHMRNTCKMYNPIICTCIKMQSWHQKINYACLPRTLHSCQTTILTFTFCGRDLVSSALHLLLMYTSIWCIDTMHRHLYICFARSTWSRLFHGQSAAHHGPLQWMTAWGAVEILGGLNEDCFPKVCRACYVI